LKASEYYKTKPLNVVNQKRNVKTEKVFPFRTRTVSDGTTTIRIFKDGWKRAYSFRVRNLGRADEEIIEDEEVESS
jgi:hypothetical protein